MILAPSLQGNGGWNRRSIFHALSPAAGSDRDVLFYFLGNRCLVFADSPGNILKSHAMLKTILYLLTLFVSQVLVFR
jgi:hypothetical protein